MDSGNLEERHPINGAFGDENHGEGFYKRGMGPTVMGCCTPISLFATSIGVSKTNYTLLEFVRKLLGFAT
jgi:hypothetical protein